MRFQFHGPALADRPVISVDGVTPRGPNFSHWPGNRTPKRFKADTSTEIALVLAALPAAERAREFDGLEIVSNNHFDTDGVLSCFAVLEPETALRHRERMLRAATAGDFQFLVDEEALAIDLTILDLGSKEGPHRGELARLTGAERGQRQYELALAAVPTLLADPFAFRDRIGDAVRRESRQVDYARRLARVERFPEHSFVILESDLALTRLAANTVAGDCVRVLEIVADGDGWRYRFHERVETWFELRSRTYGPRLDLAPLVHRLNEIETARTEERWHADALDAPVVEAWFGTPAGEGSFTELDPTILGVSRIKPRLLRAAFLDHFAGS